MTFDIIITISLGIAFILLYISYKKLQTQIEDSKNKENDDYYNLNKKIEKDISNFKSFKVNNESHLVEIKNQFTLIGDQLTSIKDQFNLMRDNNLSSFTEVRNSIDKIEENISNIDNDLNKKILSFQNQANIQFSQIDQYINEFNDSLETMSKENSEKLQQVINILLDKIENIKKENDILRKKLEQFSEIKDDSNKLNEFVDIEQENEIIRNILEKKGIKQVKKNEPLGVKLNDGKDISEITVSSETHEETIEKNIEEVHEQTTYTLTGSDKTDQAIKYDLYSVIQYTDVENLHNIISEQKNLGNRVYIRINSNYSLKEYTDTIQEVISISRLYPNKTVFYIKFDKHNISVTSVSDFLLKKVSNQTNDSEFSNQDELRNIESLTEEKKLEPFINTIPEEADNYSGGEDQDVVNKNEEEPSELGLDPQQEKAFQLMENTKHNVFISGRAGTGKSFLLKIFSYGTKKKHLIVAPTGIAALNVNGATLHSSFGYNNLELDADQDIIKLKNEKKEVLKQIEVLIIDEISMVRADVLDKIDNVLRKVNNRNTLFGGKQVFIFGDLFQLPPIATRNEYRYLQDQYGGVFFFHSHVYRSGDFKYVELNMNHRQNEDHTFFGILNNIREGKTTNQDIDRLNSRYTKNADLRRVLKLFPKKEKVERINNEELSKIQAKEYEFYASTEYSRTGKQMTNIDSIFPINMHLRLKLGALIMMIKNDINKRWVNGTLGIVSHINDTTIKVTIDGIEYSVERETFDYKEAKYYDGKIYYETVYTVKQYPLVLAYAITIHKSQGMTYKNVACDLTETFASGQSYVALSRCSSLEGLHLLEKITGKEIETSQEIITFYRDVIEISA